MRINVYSTSLGEIQDVVQSAGVLEKLGQPGHYTLFAPTNKAFQGLGREVLERLRGDKGVLKGKVSALAVKKITRWVYYSTLTATFGVHVFRWMNTDPKANLF